MNNVFIFDSRTTIRGCIATNNIISMTAVYGYASEFPPVFCNDTDCCLINAHNKFLFEKQLLCAKGNDLQAIPTVH